MPVMPKPAWGVQVPQHQELCLIPRYSWPPLSPEGFHQLIPAQQIE